MFPQGYVFDSRSHLFFFWNDLHYFSPIRLPLNLRYAEMMNISITGTYKTDY